MGGGFLSSEDPECVRSSDSYLMDLSTYIFCEGCDYFFRLAS